MTHKILATAWLLFLLTGVLAGQPAASAPSFPDTPDGRRLESFFAAATKQNEQATRAFIETNFPAEALKEIPLAQRLRRIHGLVARWGPFDLVRVLPARPDAAGALARSRKTGGLVQVVLELEAGSRRGVLGVNVDEAEEDTSVDQKPKATDAELSSAVDAFVAGLAARDKFSGVVLLARHGKPFLAKAWGLSDRDFSVPNRPDTKFNVGSIGKAFTQAAVMDLARAGRLSLDDTVAKWLPDAKIPSSGQMNVRQLLDMTSGLGDIFGPKYDAAPKDRLRALSDFLPLFEGQPLQFEPGAGRGYSNAGYVVLGLIVEKASGRPYWDFVRDRVFAVAGMKESGPFGPDEVAPNRAIGYTRSDDGTWRSNVYSLPGRASSAGGVDCTAEDLLRFAAAIRERRLSVRAPEAPRGESYGIAGGTEGANAVLEDLPGGLTVVVLANLDPPAAERVARQIRAWAPGPSR